LEETLVGRIKALDDERIIVPDIVFRDDFAPAWSESRYRGPESPELGVTIIVAS
jgi:hypothetical protein